MNRVTHFLLDTGYRFSKAITYSALLSATGFSLGVAFGMNSRLPQKSPDKEEKKIRMRNILVDKIHRIESFRRGAEMFSQVFIPMLANAEYDARRTLESMGYYPCTKCGIAHVQPDEGENCLPRGAYWSSGLQRYIHTGHPNWSEEEYEQVTGQKWIEDGDEDQMH